MGIMLFRRKTGFRIRGLFIYNRELKKCDFISKPSQFWKYSKIPGLINEQNRNFQQNSEGSWFFLIAKRWKIFFKMHVSSTGKTIQRNDLLNRIIIKNSYRK